MRQPPTSQHAHYITTMLFDLTSIPHTRTIYSPLESREPLQFGDATRAKLWAGTLVQKWQLLKVCFILTVGQTHHKAYEWGYHLAIT